MTDPISRHIEGDRILVLGFGKEGESTFKYIRDHLPGKSVSIADRDPAIRQRMKKYGDTGSINLYLGDSYLDSLGYADLVIKSPGVFIPQHILDRHAGLKITTQTKLVMDAYASRTIGITGTKGKSTTSSLVYHILDSAGIDCILAGNIGRPALDQADRITPGTRIVYELSSNQLEDIGIAPGISVLLNLFPEHLDRYHSVDEYYRVKMNAFRSQPPGSTAIYNADIPDAGKYLDSALDQQRRYSFSNRKPVENGCYLDRDNIYLCTDGECNEYLQITDEYLLKGRHNHMNIMAAILAGRAVGIDDSTIIEGIRSFRGLEHRLEYVGQFGGIRFYNDSIATIPEATIQAIDTLEDIDTLILGGYDRGLDYSELMERLKDSQITNFMLMGPAGKRMAGLLGELEGKGRRMFMADHLEDLLPFIVKYTREGMVCLLSPAAASYDSFRNFEERGNAFKKMARNL